jgi:hypothetical protein
MFLGLMWFPQPAIAVKWDESPRAEHYRIWKQVEGTDKEMVAAGNAGDPDFTIEEAPRGARISIAVSAVNNGGESGRSHSVTVIMPSRVA